MEKNKYSLNLEEFKKKAFSGNLIPVYREILADLETPVSAFLKIGAQPYSYLLESVEGGEKWARYSFLGSQPSLVFQAKGKMVEIKEGKDKKIMESDDPLRELKKIMEKFRPVSSKGLPRFYGGMVGYLSYDAVRHFEKLPDSDPDDLNLPDYFFMLTDTLLIFDNIEHTIKIVSNAFVSGSEEEAYRKAVEKIERIEDLLKKPLFFKNGKKKKEQGKGWISNFTSREFEAAVARAQKSIYEGEAIQVVLSQCLKEISPPAAIDIYRALRLINPSPYMYYLGGEDFQIIGSSPEILVRKEGEKVEVRPIAGTRRRGKDNEEDEKLARELLSDPKEKAEHIMLVDLGRNDVGRVSLYGTVEVSERMGIEKYSHVMHIVSHIQGKLAPGCDEFNVLRSCFPAGTVTGAPKIRAMEIIDELENIKRGPYAGALGYFSFSHNMDMAITIRTIVIKDNFAYVQAGAGIVADSIPEKEYQETMNKARAMIKAVELARKGL